MAIGENSEELEAARQEYQKKIAAQQKRLGQVTKQFQNLKKQSARLKDGDRKKPQMDSFMYTTTNKTVLQWLKYRNRPPTFQP